LPRAGHTASLGLTLFTDYLFPFEVVSMILLVALIGASILGRRE
ncbi:NADH-quinone oxidoreductase subunit J, partial [candidate division TA06 bacterium]|nr:NADH-quinone oxidoreductase subunit J [candidate division TA06 bacterium]